MAPTQNKALIFKKVPNGAPVPGQDLAIEDRPIDLDTTEPPSDGLLVKVHYVSFDPYQRGRMRSPEIKSYSSPFQVDTPITNSVVATVLKSGNSKFKKGDLVVNFMAAPTEEYSVWSGELVNNSVRKLENPYNIDPKTFIGALGMPGLTAYSSFYAIGEPKKGETIFISAASGAVGQFVGQLAKREGLTVVGSVGDDKKLDYIIKDLGFDGGFNYKKEKPADGLARVAPDGIDIYYENVGGEHLEAAIGAMKQFGRIIACGMVSQYNATKPYGVPNLMQVVAKRIKMQGFIVGDQNMGPKYTKEHQENVQKWISEGSFKVRMSTTDGIDKAAEGFVGMLEGKNFGKAVLVIDDLKQTSTSQPKI